MKREKSIITNDSLEELHSIKKFPVFIGATDEPIESDIFADLTFDICKDSGFIQLREPIDPKLVYSKFHSEAIGKTWEKHHSLFSELISVYSSKKRVLEIGGSDSRLALKTLSSNPLIKKWIVFEPNIKIKFDEPNIEYIEDFFNKDTYKKVNKCDIIIHSHVLEHSLDPNDFLNSISESLDEGAFHIFSIPNLYEYLKSKFVNTLNFEHTIFLTEEFVDYILFKNGFRIVDKKYYENHSIFYVTVKDTKADHFISLPRMYEKYKNLYNEFVNCYFEFIKETNAKLLKTNKKIYLFGAHVFSQYLIHLGLDTSKIKCILDNSDEKEGKRLYGTDLFIRKPKNVDLEDSIVILKVGQYKNEIVDGLLKLNKNIQFYE